MSICSFKAFLFLRFRRNGTFYNIFFFHPRLFEPAAMAKYSLLMKLFTAQLCMRLTFPYPAEPFPIAAAGARSESDWRQIGRPIRCGSRRLSSTFRAKAYAECRAECRAECLADSATFGRQWRIPLQISFKLR